MKFDKSQSASALDELHKPLYHGSNVSFTTIDLSKSAPKKDFGSGFYTTTNKLQAEKFARLKAKRMRANIGFVGVFHINNLEDINIKKFDSANEEWFDFVLTNRGYSKFAAISQKEVFDIVIGPVANDAVGLVLNQFIAGIYGDPKFAESKATAIRLLLTQKLHNQVFLVQKNPFRVLVFQRCLMFVLTKQAINSAIDAISGYIVSVVSAETKKPFEDVSEAFLASDAYVLLSDPETGYYWDSMGELIDKFKTEIAA